MLSAVGKFFALFIIVFMVVWLAPMCARIPDNLTTTAAPLPTAVVAPGISTVTMPAPAPGAALAKPAPIQARPPLTVATYRSRKMFPMTDDKYIVSVLRTNKAEVAAVGVTMTLTSHMKGQNIERSESGPGQTLGAGTTSYFGLTVSTVVFDELLSAPEEPGTELEWFVSYRFQDDAPDMKRCTVLKALPRRREPEGITWLARGQSHQCPALAK